MNITNNTISTINMIECLIQRKHWLFYRAWEILYGPLKGSCPTNTGTMEKCDQPVIPSCIDRNKYCTLPPGMNSACIQ